MKNKQKVDAFLAVFFVLLVMGYLLHQSPEFAGSLRAHTLISGFGSKSWKAITPAVPNK